MQQPRSIPRTSVEQWAVLAAVIDHGGFAQAAAALGRSQSGVSYGIARLQEGLGVPLLSLSGRRAQLTPHGDVLLRRARHLLRDLQDLETLAHSLQQGWEAQLNVTVEAAFPRPRLLSIIAELQHLCPQTRLQFSEAVLSGAEDAIVDGQADLVITTRVPEGFLGEYLFDVGFVAVAAPAHPLIGLGHPLTAEDLAKHVQAVIRDSGVRRPRDEGWLGTERRCTVSSMEAALDTVLAGLAFAWLLEHVVHDALQHEALRRLPLVSGTVRRVPLYLVLVRPQRAGPAARAAVESFQRHLPRASAQPE